MFQKGLWQDCLQVVDFIMIVFLWLHFGSTNVFTCHETEIEVKGEGGNLNIEGRLEKPSSLFTSLT